MLRRTVDSGKAANDNNVTHMHWRLANVCQMRFQFAFSLCRHHQSFPCHRKKVVHTMGWRWQEGKDRRTVRNYLKMPKTCLVMFVRFQSQTYFLRPRRRVRFDATLDRENSNPVGCVSRNSVYRSGNESSMEMGSIVKKVIDFLPCKSCENLF